MRKVFSAGVMLASMLAAVPAFAADTTTTTTTAPSSADVTRMLAGVDFSNAEAGIISAGGLIAGLIVVATAVKWALKFLRA